jgi:hypothetical protein
LEIGYGYIHHEEISYMKKCPYCAEKIQNEAILCRHCGNILGSAIPSGKEGLSSQNNIGRFMYILIPVSIILVLFHGCIITAFFIPELVERISIGMGSARPAVLPNPGLVRNSSFETGSALPDNWVIDAWQSGSNFDWDGSNSHNGGKSIRIESPIHNDARWIQTVPVHPNTDYILSGWIKTENVKHVDGPTESGANLGLFGTWSYTNGIYGTHDWTYVSMEFNSGGNSYINVACRLGYWAGTVTGTMWCDDIELTRK